VAKRAIRRKIIELLVKKAQSLHSQVNIGTVSNMVFMYVSAAVQSYSHQTQNTIVVVAGQVSLDQSTTLL